MPGDNDPWASTFSGGAAATLPRRGVPEIFTSRVKRVFQQTKGEGAGEAVWSSNPCRVGYFTQEIVVFRDDVVGRLRRNCVNFKKEDDGVVKGDEMEVEVTGDGELISEVLVKGKGKEKEKDIEKEKDKNEVDLEVKNARKVTPPVCTSNHY